MSPPTHTGIGLDIDTLVALGTIPKEIGIKDVSGDVVRVSKARGLLGQKFLQLSGCDDSALGFMVTSGQGCISVTSNVALGL